VLHSVYGAPFAVLWLAWLVYWFLAALNVKATRRREDVGSLIINRGLIVVGAFLLAFQRQPLHWLSARFLPLSMAAYWVGLVTLAAGLAFTVWARRHLGRNWSGIVTVKQDHELVRSGPYRVVRHPIYTGLLLAILGTAIAFGQWRGLIAFALMTIGLVLKLRTEERFMVETFGGQYARYRAEVPALIPFIV
jgi:protein-S-isoprenylcysteine O-methyltransferase Ste14